MKANALRIAIRFGGSIQIDPVYLDSAQPVVGERSITVPATRHGANGQGWIVHVNFRGQLEQWFRENAILGDDDEPAGPTP
jgi:hypothetical protein